MKRIIATIAIAVVGFCAPAYAQKTPPQLITEIQANWPDNTTGAITPALLRNTVIDIVNSYWTLVGPAAQVTPGNYSVNCGVGAGQFMFNPGGGITITAPPDGRCTLQIINASGSATNPTGGTVTLAGFAALAGPRGGDVFNNAATLVTSVTITASSTAGTVTLTGAPLTKTFVNNNGPVFFSWVTAPTGLTQFQVYYAQNVTSNTLQLSSATFGALLPITTVGTTVQITIPSVFDLQMETINSSGLGTFRQLQ